MLNERLGGGDMQGIDTADIFLSYSRSDTQIAESLYEKLTSMGKTVWFDTESIDKGYQWRDEIRNGINTARYFVPVFTSSIEEEKNEPHVYRAEWDEAIQVAKSLGRKYIIPVASADFDFYKANIPEKMREINAIIFNDDCNLDQVAEQIVETINKE